MNNLIAELGALPTKPTNPQGELKAPHFYMCNFGVWPSFNDLHDLLIPIDNFIKIVKGSDFDLKITKIESKGSNLNRVFLIDKHNRLLVLLTFERISSQGNLVLNDDEMVLMTDDKLEVVEDISILYDVDKLESANALQELLESNRMKFLSEREPTVSFLAQEEMGGLYLRDFTYEKDQVKALDFDLDLHYGDGFNKKYTNLLEKTKDTKKGIMLLYGESGTGKSWLIRRMIKDFVLQKKRVVFVSSNMIDALMSPSANEFFTDTANYLDEWDEDAKEFRRLDNLVFILEDCDQFITPRQDMGFNSSVSTFLNTSDGIPNDFVKFQFVLSFNKSIHDVDQALYRNGRGIFAHKFSALDKEDAVKLAEHIGVSDELIESIDDDMKSSEVYSLLNPVKQNELLSDVFEEVESTGAGFRNT